MSRGGRRATIRLRPGVRWHDGRPLTARDVAFTFRRFRARPHPRFTPQLAAVASVRATDRTTVVVELRHASLGFRDQPLADVPILPRHLWRGVPREELAPAGLPVGSGPYRLVEHRPGAGYRFRANRRYFRGRPSVARIDVRVIEGAGETFSAFERRAVDVVPAPLPERERARLDDLGVEIARGPSYAGTVLMFNLRRPPLDRLEVRRAIAAALDPARLARAVSGAAAADRGYLHPRSPWAPRAPLERPPAATVAMAPLTIAVSDADPTRLQVGREVVLALRRAGVDAALRPLAPPLLAAAVGQDGAPPDFDAAIWSSPPLASYDPDFLRVVFGAGQPLNYSGFSSPRFEELAQRVAAAPTRAERRAAVREELRLLADELPVVPLIFQEGTFAYRRGRHDGWVFVKGAGILDKRSFFARRRAVRPRGAAPAPPAAAGDSSTGLAGWLAAGAAMAALALAGAAARRRRG